MKNTSRGFAHILLILVVLLGVGALGYYTYAKKGVSVKPHTDVAITDIPLQRADWQTFKSSTYTIQYPSDWKQEYDELGNVTLYNPAKITQRQNNGSGTYPYREEFVTISLVESNQTGKQFVDNLVERDAAYISIDKDKLDRKSVTVDGQSAEMINEEGEGSSGYAIYVLKDTTLFHIGTSTNSLTNGSTEAQIIATFTFTH